MRPRAPRPPRPIQPMTSLSDGSRTPYSKVNVHPQGVKVPGARGYRPEETRPFAPPSVLMSRTGADSLGALDGSPAAGLSDSAVSPASELSVAASASIAWRNRCLAMAAAAPAAAATATPRAVHASIERMPRLRVVVSGLTCCAVLRSAEETRGATVVVV